MRYGPFLVGLAVVVLLAGCGREAPPPPAGPESPDAYAKRHFPARLQAGREALEAKRYDDAITELEEAERLRLEPETVAGLLTRARAEKHEQLVSAGRTALAARQYDQAIRAFADAIKLTPLDDEVRRLHDQVVIQVWKNAGAEVGWMRVRSEGLVTRLEYLPDGSPLGSAREGDYCVAFRLRPWKPGVLAKLPAPNANFGLDLSYSSFGDDGIDDLAALRSVYILDVSGSKLTEEGKKRLRQKVTVHWMSL